MNWIIWLIIACEIGFWVFILLGLVTRYIFKKESLGLFLLAMTPVVDFILLAATSYDLYQGATATTAHALAAIYIGVSIGFGKSMIKWADERFSYYVTKTGPKPVKLYGIDYAKTYFKSWLRHLLSYVIGATIIGIIYVLINDYERTEAMVQILGLWSLVLVIDLVLSITYFIFPRKKESRL
ncbi:hypothetical protein [Ornithinibacillus halophilus]|uniref:Membrane protein YmcC n=1 Tax=Ornithinibacillus halophilus TaxID=930117 RepID=A0A1M5N1V9_9BACI|nr:hypothetical protein [Ornithinibacillus halophilus]SHG83546.1 hypothetical protein SAMN05216225_10693 [Ornithinibacillus halophilus]